MPAYNEQATREMFAAISRGNTSAALRALEEGADPNATEGEQRNSPLMLAALYHQPQVAKALLDKGANPDYARRQGDTALMLAGFSCDRGTAKAIIDAGANVLLQDHFNADAVMHALREGNKEMAKFIETTARERDERTARQKAEAELRRNIADIVETVEGGLQNPMRVRQPLRFMRSGRHDA